MSKKHEVDQIVEVLGAQKYDVIGVLFYDQKTKMLGISPMSGVPDAFVEKVGQRLGFGAWSATK